MIFSAIILLACTVHLGRCVTLELYSGQQYSGRRKNITLDKYRERRCTKLYDTYEVRSIKTDKCVMIYETADCNHIDANAPGNGAMYSLRVEGNTKRFDIDGAYPDRKDERHVQSFHACNREKGGGITLDIDIYGGRTYTGDVLASYGGVCGCKNIPSSIVTKGKYLSIDNHGNSIYFYNQEDCTGLQRLIPAGDSERSRSVFQFHSSGEVIRSFRPVDSLSCPPGLDTTIYWFSFSKGPITGGITEDVAQYLTTTVTNTRPFPATVYFNTSIPITVKYSVARPYTYFVTMRLKQHRLQMSFDNELKVLLGGNTEALRRSIEANYRYRNTNPRTGTIDVTIPVQDHGSIDMNACETCELTYFVRRVPISYMNMAYVSGDDSDGNELNEEQLLDLLPPGVAFTNSEEHGVMVLVEGEMTANFPFRDHKKTFCKSVLHC